MTKEDYEKITTIIREKSGIKLEPRDYKRIGCLVKERLKKLKVGALGEYVEHLRSDRAIAEIEALTNDITISETYFFRDAGQCDALRDYILPSLIKSKKEKKIRIWSAGCSTGEEAYTSAIILNQVISDRRQWDIEIIGTDINRRSIDEARNGVYSKYSFRGLNEEIIDRHFSKTPKGMSVNDSMRSMVKFDVFNLKLDQGSVFPDRYRGFDVIFCRNVLIYLESKVTDNILKGFSNSLLPQGYLILGHSEAALIPKRIFRPIRTNDTFLYMLHTEATAQKLKPEKTGGLPPTTRSFQPINHKPKSETHYSASQPVNQSAIYHKALTLYFQEKYSKAEEELENLLTFDNVSVEGLLLASLIRVNMGKFKEAISLVKKIQQKDEFLPDAHFVYGLIFENEGNYEQATRAYQAALFLKSNFFLSYFRLGHLYHKEEKRSYSVRAFKSALNLIDSEDEDRIRLLSGGFSRKNLEDICKRWIKD